MSRSSPAIELFSVAFQIVKNLIESNPDDWHAHAARGALLLCCHDKTARVWDAANGHLLTVLQSHTGLIYGAVFSPDGQRILTASRDGTARVFRVITFSEIADVLAK